MVFAAPVELGAEVFQECAPKTVPGEREFLIEVLILTVYIPGLIDTNSLLLLSLHQQSSIAV
jgi:hypothetical protein